MKKIVAVLTAVILSSAASADYVSFNINGNDQLINNAGGYSFDFRELSNDIRIDIKVGADTKAYFEGAKDFFNNPVPGVYTAMKFIDAKSGNPLLGDDYYFDNSVLTVLSVSGEDEIRLTFSGNDGAINLSGEFCIGASCGNAPAVTPEVPVPAAVWLMGSGLIGLAGIARRRKS